MSKIRGMGSRCIEIVPCAFDGVTISASDNNNGHACPSFTPAQTREIIAALQDAVGGEGAWGSARCLSWLHTYCVEVRIRHAATSGTLPVEVRVIVLRERGGEAMRWIGAGGIDTAVSLLVLREAVHEVHAARFPGEPCPLGEACPVEGCPPVAEPDDWLRMCRSRCWDCCSCARGGQCANFKPTE